MKVVAAQFRHCTKSHRIVHFKMVNLMLLKLKKNICLDDKKGKAELE